ncbi:phosphonoacetaldehyde hydrolase-like [Dreissena polymorpha]|uniref:Phosphonoacetaldehyde hydrolase n=1 Tax=Dreissena polymorpha TaxID=45954 RepID=A0A9D4I862_DREPO|nr:phosphonoacetaldehyde hydrolase-like [Dreissena polymorpha]XP_052234426.1 phosphonoacetaldehyde hydrolase-like [Dreissena polymorpha]XP_052234427.1 phosphonoacetaldehyde hydrolase-like [Dreissena polymorpha]KAH3750713.1 hypothetical protein DPMN_185244 [Dreissena polymorpha]
MSRHFRFVRQYVGGLKAAILDWSGTTADKYVIAPAVVFVEVFEKHKVPISMKEARLPMGLRKDLHIKAITEIPEVRERWRSVYGKDPNQGDVDNMFRDFVPLQLACLHKYTTLIPGTVEAVNALKNEFGLKIGSTTGFTRPMVDILLKEAIKQGFKPDCTVAGDEVVHGARPRPFMVYRNLDLLDITPIQAVVKVDDTVSGVGEALNAGCWGVGVARYSNYMDVDSLEHEARIGPEDMKTRLEHSRDLLRKTGAHYVIDSIAELPEVCADINSRLARGESP